MSDPTTTATERPPGRGLRRLAVWAVAASFVGIWGYVMYLSLVEGREEPRDRLEDTTWTASAEAACARSTPVFESLPFANEADDPVERAQFLAAGTDELEEMVDRLEALPPPATSEEASAVARWLADYRAFIVDRREYEAALRTGQDDAFTVTDRGGYQLDVLIDDFARVNFMESCETPDDVG